MRMEKKKKKKGKLIKSALILSVVAVLLVAIGATSVLIIASGASFDASKLPKAEASPVFYDINGEPMESKGSSAIKPEEIPDCLKNAFIAMEDKRFYDHKGYDVVRMGGALLNNLKSGGIKEGASTITQQLVKNTHLSHEKTITRKIREISIAREIEKRYSKDEIIAMYLSVIYFGNGIYGAKDAAKAYFSKNIEELTLSECATLAGIVKNPQGYSPVKSKAKAIERRNLVLKLMFEQGRIGEDEYETAKSEDLIVNESVEKPTDSSIYISECVKEILTYLNITKYQLENSGYKIYTNFDPKAQAVLKNAICDKSFYSDSELDGAAMLVDNESGAVIAYYSTIPYSFKRQIGSAIKPIAVYAPALELKKITAGSPIKDEVISYGSWTPSNYKDIYYGWTTPREALKKSMNTVAVKTLSYVGADKGADFARRFGINIDSEDETLALALGATKNGVSLKEAAQAYSALANLGVKRNLGFVKMITDGNGGVIYKNNAEETRVISEQTAYIITDILMDTAKHGTAKVLASLPFDVASKTGTVGKDFNTDAWNLSYTTKHTLAVWHGGKETQETGGGGATRCAKYIWSNIYGADTPSRFSPPEGILEAEIDLYALEYENRLLLASENTPAKYKKTELFSADNIPEEISTVFTNLIADFEISFAQRSGEHGWYDSSIECVIKLKTSPLYDYIIEKSSIHGDTVISQIEGDGNEFTINDLPQIGPNEYRVTVFLKGDREFKYTTVKKIFAP